MRPAIERAVAQLRQIVRVPVTRDPGDQLSADLVARTIDVLVVAASTFAALQLLGTGRMPIASALTLGPGIVLLLALRRLLSRGRVRLVAAGLCAFGWFAVAADLGVHGAATVSLGGFIIIAVIGGLTIGPVAPLILGGATLALLAPFELGLVGADFPAPTGGERLLHYATQICLAGVLAGWWAMRTRALVTHLRNSEARRTLLLEESPDAIVASDINGVITFQNRAAEAMFGYPASEILGRPWIELPALKGANVERLMLQFMSALSGNPSPPEELILTHRSGEPVVVEAKGVAMRDDGQVVGTIAILRDATARKKAESDRASLQEQLLTAQRMEAMGRIAGGVAHDFNNLLTIIVSGTEALAGPERDLEALEDVREAARRGIALTRQLLTFSRRELANDRPLDINQAIREIRPMLARLLGERVSLQLDLAPSVPAVLIDAGHLDQVLVNFAANAGDAMPRGGTFTLSTAVRESAGGKSGKSGKSVEIQVSDTGVGMDAETIASAFEPFFTTKGERGTGLGLSVVHGVVKGVGGTISVKSTPGAGTTFLLSLPATDQIAETGVPRAIVAPRKAPRVVLVDDDEMVRRGISRALRGAGFEVFDFDAPDNEEDVAEIVARLDGAAAVITDVVMRAISGVDLALELRRRGCPLPILLISGYAQHALIERAGEVSRSRLLQKPFTPADVQDRLEELRS